MNFESESLRSQPQEAENPTQENVPSPRPSILNNPLYTMTDTEVLDGYEKSLKSQRPSEDEGADADRRFIDIAGKRLKVDAYTDAWRQKAEKFQSEPQPVERQLDMFMTKLKRVVDHAESAKRQLSAIREADAGKESGKALTPEVEAQISEKLLPFQSFFEYEAILDSMSETMDDVTALAHDSVRSGDNSQMEATRNQLASSEYSTDENR